MNMCMYACIYIYIDRHAHYIIWGYHGDTLTQLDPINKLSKRFDKQFATQFSMSKKWPGNPL